MTISEKQKMLAGEPYDAWDEELYAERIACRKILQRLNNAIPNSPEWQNAQAELIPDAVNPHLEPPFRCDYGSNIKLGKNFYANFNCVILDVAEVKIGDNVLFGPSVQLYAAGHPLDVESRVEQGIEFGAPIVIGNNVWIGGGAIVCPGVKIGNNSVIGAGSVVTKDVPDNVVAAGNPCRVIKSLEKATD
ncbi:sugar O-acetyltransferase [Vibrio intestinalis]|uniref:sugar O-acetyltransferase n=1 Tax=Vibrio intestinalis TaxID=2933291 RepID=UPI0021A4A702|nr:sugar O-acetyltransferase [Vibrio intestinalis]